MKIEFHADSGELLTPLEVANCLIMHTTNHENTFSTKDLKEIADYLQVYYRHHDNRDDVVAF